MLAPAPISDIYSDVDMRLHLAVASNADTSCIGMDCVLSHDFDQRVQQLGIRLGKAAFVAYPEVKDRVDHFEFVVAEKEELGSASNATGTIVVFRGVQKLYLDDEGLAFLLAREMGHVIGHHHDENSVPTIAFTVLTTVIFPVAGILKGASFLASSSSATAAVTSTSAMTAAASSATSYVGSHAILASLRPDQLSEADEIAMRLLAGIGCDQHQVASVLESCTELEGDNGWVEDFHLSTAHVSKLAALSAENDVRLTNQRTDIPSADLPMTQDVPLQAAEPMVGRVSANIGPEVIVGDEGGNLPLSVGQDAEPTNKSDDVVKAPTVNAEALISDQHQEAASPGGWDGNVPPATDVAGRVVSDGAVSKLAESDEAAPPTKMVTPVVALSEPLVFRAKERPAVDNHLGKKKKLRSAKLKSAGKKITRVAHGMRANHRGEKKTKLAKVSRKSALSHRSPRQNPSSIIRQAKSSP